MRTNSSHSFSFLISTIYSKSQTLKAIFSPFYRPLTTFISSHSYFLLSFLFLFLFFFPFLLFSFLHQLHHCQVVVGGAAIRTTSNHRSPHSPTIYSPFLSLLSFYFIFIFFILFHLFIFTFLFFVFFFFFYFLLCTATNMSLSSLSLSMAIDCYISVRGIGDRARREVQC
ncbi:unnamed protein product, partial [Vitis vinifera]|uniref:Uncharacterized protein n=1 Tax=Vitis vinifera TaxID=29760 RepID=D7U3H3_VITVI